MTSRPSVLSVFLTVAGAVGVAVGGIALAAPGVLLASKGVAPAPGTEVWVRETGLLLVVAGATAVALRRHPVSPTLRVVLMANAALQFGLLPIEPLALLAGTITEPAGIVPNTVAHVLLGSGFVVAAASRSKGPLGRPTRAPRTV